MRVQLLYARLCRCLHLSSLPPLPSSGVRSALPTYSLARLPARLLLCSQRLATVRLHELALPQTIMATTADHAGSDGFSLLQPAASCGGRGIVDELVCGASQVGSVRGAGHALLYGGDGCRRLLRAVLFKWLEQRF